MVNASTIVEGAEYKLCLLKWLSKTDFKQKEYAFVLVEVEKLSSLQAAIESMQPYNPSDFGVIVESGLGEPNDAILAHFRKEFGCDFANA